MGEHFSFNPEENKDNLEEKARRLADTIRKLEKGVISEADEATQIARGAIKSFGFAISPTPVPADDEDQQL